MQQRTSRFTAFAAIAALLFAGFGCKPVLDSRLQAAQGEAQKNEAFWLKEDPAINYAHGPDLNGWITLDVRSQAGTTISAELFGPGILSNPYQEISADKDGRVHFEWKTNRIGHYRYDGSIVFNRSLVQTFSNEFDTDIGP